MTAAWAWLVLAVLIAGFVAGYDTWAILTHHDTMSGQVAAWLQHSWTGAAVIAIWVGLPAGLLYHFFRSKAG